MDHRNDFGILIVLGPKGSFELKENSYCSITRLQTIRLLHTALNINIINHWQSQLLTVVFQMS